MTWEQRHQHSYNFRNQQSEVAKLDTTMLCLTYTLNAWQSRNHRTTLKATLVPRSQHNFVHSYHRWLGQLMYGRCFVLRRDVPNMHLSHGLHTLRNTAAIHVTRRKQIKVFFSIFVKKIIILNYLYLRLIYIY